MKSEFLIVKYLKLYILSLNKYVENFPRKERELKYRIINSSYEILELVYYCNLLDERTSLQKSIIAKLSVLDFCFEYSFKNKYLSEKQFNKVSNDLTKIVKMIFGWIKSEKC